MDTNRFRLRIDFHRVKVNLSIPITLHNCQKKLHKSHIFKCILIIYNRDLFYKNSESICSKAFLLILFIGILE